MPLAVERFVGRIPVRNIWFFMVYAADHIRHNGLSKVLSDENPDCIPDLIAELLAKKVEWLLRRGPGHGFVRKEADINRVRGRILFLDTEARSLMERGKIACRFDELTVDTPRNRFIRKALEKLSATVEDQARAQRCRSLAARLRALGVKGECSGISRIVGEPYGRNDLHIRPIIELAKLAFMVSIPSEDAGPFPLPMPDREEHWMRKIFEKGIAGFFASVLPEEEWLVHAGMRIYWQTDNMSAEITNYLPNMILDIYLQNRETGRRTIIDTKFTEILIKDGYQGDTLKSAHLYQLYSYLRSQEDDDPQSIVSTGLLLHPSIGYEFHESVFIQGHKVSFETIDLTQPIKKIKESLLRIIGIVA